MRIPVYKTADESVSSASTGTTLQDDDDLTRWVVATGSYRFDLMVFFQTTDNADFKYSLTFTGTDTHVVTHEIVTGTDWVQVEARTDWTTIGFATTSTHGFVRLTGIIHVTVNGSLKLQWAQNTSHADSTTVLKGSWMFVERFD